MRPITKVLIALGLITTITGLSFAGYGQWRKMPLASTSTTKASHPTSEKLTSQGWEKVGKKDYQGAISDFTQAQKINPKDVFAYFSRGVIYSKIGDHKKADTVFTQGLQIQPKDAGLHYGRATAREQLGDTQGAMQDYRQLVNLVPHNSLDYTMRGKARFKLGNIKGANEDFEKAKKTIP